MKTLPVQFVILAALLMAGVAYSDHFDATQQNQQANYYIISLDPLGGTASAGISINNTGWVTGYSNLTGDGTTHATLWQNGLTFDLGTLGGPNSDVAWPVKNNKGLIVGIAETVATDPFGENWSCSAFFPTITHNQCLGFVLRNGVLSSLPTLGGNNGYAAGANNRNQIVGWAENTTHDATCAAPQVLQFRAVVWGPKDGQIQELPPFPGDTTSAATAINDNGQVVGISGICNRAVGRLSAIHAVRWENGAVADLGNIGVGAWNTPTAINQRGDVSGFVNQPGATVTGFRPLGVLWRKKDGLQILPKLSGDIRSIAWSINDHGQAVGQSYGGANGSHAVIWHDGVITDLNSLIPPGSLTLIFANDINDRGEITGQAYDSDKGELRAFLAIPPLGGFEAALSAAREAGNEAPKGIVPEKILKQLLRKIGVKEDDLER